jgi:hypothetical protein
MRARGVGAHSAHTGRREPRCPSRACGVWSHHAAPRPARAGESADKKAARKKRNRISAEESRRKQRDKLSTLQDQIEELKTENEVAPPPPAPRSRARQAVPGAGGRRDSGLALGGGCQHDDALRADPPCLPTQKLREGKGASSTEEPAAKKPKEEKEKEPAAAPSAGPCRGAPRPSPTPATHPTPAPHSAPSPLPSPPVPAAPQATQRSSSGYRRTLQSWRRCWMRTKSSARISAEEARGQKKLEGGEGGEEHAPPGEAPAASASASTPAAPGGGAEAGEEQHGGPTAAAEAAAPAAGPGLLSRLAGEVLPGAGAAPCADEGEEERATPAATAGAAADCDARGHCCHWHGGPYCHWHQGACQGARARTGHHAGGGGEEQGGGGGQRRPTVPLTPLAAHVPTCLCPDPEKCCEHYRPEMSPSDGGWPECEWAASLLKNPR